MGDVFRAHDMKLRRDVAIKILPPVFSLDVQRLARFEREARVLATLNHPHIGAIYGLEHINGVPALVLELVEGETLAERIARRETAAGTGLPVQEVLSFAGQITDALEAAHEKGIVHRDLKPSNIKVTPDGEILEPGYWSNDALIGRQYDVSPDGKRFLVVTPPGEKADLPDLVVIQHWDEELKATVPSK